MSNSHKNERNKKGDEDMAITQNDIKDRLYELKQRVSRRKENPNLKHTDSEVSIERMNRNAELMYQSQLDTMEESD